MHSKTASFINTSELIVKINFEMKGMCIFFVMSTMQYAAVTFFQPHLTSPLTAPPPSSFLPFLHTLGFLNDAPEGVGFSGSSSGHIE